MATPQGYERGGLNASYYSGRDLNTASTVVRGIDAQVNFNWGYGSAAPRQLGNDNFGATWKGKIQSLKTGLVNFFTTSDDGVQLKIAGSTIINKWQDQGATEHSGSIVLQAGQYYDIEVSYYENVGRARMELSWDAMGSKQLVNAADLFYSAPTSSSLADKPQSTLSGLGNSSFFSSTTEQRFGFQTTVWNADNPKGAQSGTVKEFNFDFANGSPTGGIRPDNFFIQASGRLIVQNSGWYDFFTTADDGVKLNIGGNTVISNWQDQALTTRQGGTWLNGGQNYSIDLNYYENAGLAGLKLEWSGADTGGQRQTLTARNILTFSDRMGIDIDTGNMFQAYDRTGGDMTQLRQLYPSWI
jgi:hypothetical protein